MKKYLAAAFFLAALAVTASAAAPEDSLISLRYWKETLFPQAVQAGEEAADQLLQKTYDAALAELNTIPVQPAPEDTGLFSETLQARACADGQRITLSPGGSFLMLLGSARVEHSGGVVDVTAGEEVPSGTAVRRPPVSDRDRRVGYNTLRLRPSGGSGALRRCGRAGEPHPLLRCEPDRLVLPPGGLRL